MVCALVSLSLSLILFQDSNAENFQYPVKAQILIEGFKGSEGIAFNGEGHLFITANKALWRIDPDGTKHLVAELFSNLGMASIGERDLLVADFGPTNAFRHGKNHDGIIWQITPEGEKKQLVVGIGDPNFILMLKNGSFLVSDDATNEIFLCDRKGQFELFCTAVNHPNGLALSPDGASLYVAQIFQGIKPVVPDNRIWSVKLIDNRPAAAAKLATRTGPGGANDGLVMDRRGRVYIAANNEGRVWRFDPSNDELIVIAEGMFGAASIAFGEGDFDPQSLYITTTNSRDRGGKLYVVKTDAFGLPTYR